jgi:hypothetical protein
MPYSFDCSTIKITNIECIDYKVKTIYDLKVNPNNNNNEKHYRKNKRTKVKTLIK